jgi:hypothetical protein
MIEEQMLRRFFRECFHPNEKCQRIGHKEQLQTRKGFTPPENYRWDVADEVTQGRAYCSRCGHVIEDWKTVKRHGIQGLSMPQHCFEQMRETGFTSGF